eukprot:CAMPEP_0183702880 /NCGR_PEP_ID=MMETSP0737-20130205/833_1 /TAXON_ID=385413 /ORGANISM="Thalassiosira miniscula, Strain CCMP1093" /LENGTH=454 /DNA_ID=CAMNT_0025929563 /DNA_START=63 /DNA_END=1427 /DNA_ORIENTATION=-
MTIAAVDDHVATDEEIARALQEQFRREEEQAAAAAAARNTASRAGRPTTTSVITRDATMPWDASSEHKSDHDDAAVARRLAREEELRAAAAFSTTSPTMMYSGGHHGGHFDGDDAEMARRAEQEERDAALAASIAQQDQQLAASARGSSRGGAANLTGQDEATRHRLRRRRSCNTCLAVIVACTIAFVMFRFLPLGQMASSGGGNGGIPFDFADWFQDGGWETGYKGDGDNAWAYSARGGSSGLNLKVLNNLDEKWKETFGIVMDEWDHGDPDAVSFEIENIDDPSCSMVSNAMVVCNGNYGRTSWRGINELLTNNGFVVASVAKLNDYYLEGTDTALRQYVCCHEIGHGLGLGHTDEGIYNKDLGECMDYTVRPEVNMHPGRTNFEALEEMYGVIDGGRNRQHRPGRRAERVEYSADDLEWRMLRRTAQSEHYESDLGDGRKVRRVLLLAEYP